jgi:hypothetical protein
VCVCVLNPFALRASIILSYRMILLTSLGGDVRLYQYNGWVDIPYACQAIHVAECRGLACQVAGDWSSRFHAAAFACFPK